MGQKVNPKSFRLIKSRDWQSQWFAHGRELASVLIQDLKLRRYLEPFRRSAAIAGVKILRRGDEIKIEIKTAKPGLLIGRGGEAVTELKKGLEGVIGDPTKKLTLDILEVKNPYLSASLVAQQIASAIERRVTVRRAVRMAIDRVMEAKAAGVKVLVKGRLGGAAIARQELHKVGRLPLSTIEAAIDFAQEEAKTTYGVIGVKVWIAKGKEEEE